MLLGLLFSSSVHTTHTYSSYPDVWLMCDLCVADVWNIISVPQDRLCLGLPADQGLV